MKIALMALALAASGVAAAADVAPVPAAPPPPAAGPIAIDMSIEAAKGAAPAVAWKDVASRFTGKTIAIAGDHAWTLAGHPYRVSLIPRGYGAASLDIAGRQQVKDIAACRARVLALAEHFDGYFENLDVPWDISGGRPAVTINWQRSPEGFGYVTAQPTVESDAGETESGQVRRILAVGRHAKIRESQTGEKFAAWAFGQSAKANYPFSIDAYAQFSEGIALLGEKNLCAINAELRADPPGRPAFEMLDTTKIKPVKEPSAFVKHTSIDGVELPAQGVTFVFTCPVSRQTGRLGGCWPVSGKDDRSPQARAAQMRLREIAFDPKDLDPDNDVALRTDITIKLSPADRDPKLAAAGPPAPGATPVWAKTATQADLSRHYPQEAIRRELEALVTATCRIEADLSVDCAGLETDPPGLTMFEEPARRVLSYYRAAPTLANGTPAAGAVVQLRVRFKLAD